MLKCHNILKLQWHNQLFKKSAQPIWYMKTSQMKLFNNLVTHK